MECAKLAALSVEDNFGALEIVANFCAKLAEVYSFYLVIIAIPANDFNTIIV